MAQREGQQKGWLSQGGSKRRARARHESNDDDSDPGFTTQEKGKHATKGTKTNSWTKDG